MFNDHRDNNTRRISAEAFSKMSEIDQRCLLTIIRLFLEHDETINHEHTSYDLKNKAEVLMPSGYVSHGAMKGAMLYCGYKAFDTANINWNFNISAGSELLSVNFACAGLDDMRARVRREVERKISIASGFPVSLGQAPISEDRLNAILEGANEASGDAWYYNDEENVVRSYRLVGIPPDTIFGSVVCDVKTGLADGRLISEARIELPLFAAEIKKLRRENERVSWLLRAAVRSLEKQARCSTCERQDHCTASTTGGVCATGYWKWCETYEDDDAAE